MRFAEAGARVDRHPITTPLCGPDPLPTRQSSRRPISWASRLMLEGCERSDSPPSTSSCRRRYPVKGCDPHPALAVSGFGLTDVDRSDHLIAADVLLTFPANWPPYESENAPGFARCSSAAPTASDVDVRRDAATLLVRAGRNFSKPGPLRARRCPRDYDKPTVLPRLIFTPADQKRTPGHDQNISFSPPTRT
jgi:hypothetical protein